MIVSQGAAMVFDRGIRVASIPSVVLALVLTFASANASAAVTLLRDADIEYALGQMAAPILRAAGLSPTRVRVLVVNDSSLNAFVVDNQTIYLHSGLIQKVPSARALQAVIAHEAAHISNGHIARRMTNLRSARTAAGLGLALAIIAAAAGGGEAAGGIAAGTSSSALRNFLKHTRAEEAAADRSAANYMRRAGVNPRGLIELHQLFRGQEILSVSRQDPYTRSHPLTTDRIRAAQAFVASYGDDVSANPTADYWFARAQGKLTAFTRSPKWTMRRAGEEPFEDVRLMREAVAHHKLRDLNKSLNALNGAIALRPQDAFLYDLKGQILIENRQLPAALKAYERAVEIAPRNSLVQGGYGRALLAAGQPKAALTALETARSRDFRDARVMRDMAQAYAQTGQDGMAAMVTAERYALHGRMEDAGRQAQRAIGQLPRGSAAWQRAQDVLSAAEKAQKRRK
ncbi:MAG: M48 family metalloprotease [Pseudomonadota bacterium]